MQSLDPIVKVIGHTEFHGVPDDLLPIATAKAVIEAEQAKVDPALRHDGSEAAGAMDMDLEDEGIAERALQIVHDKGQNQGTTGERLIECAGRACYDSYGVGRPSNEYHKHIIEVDHGSVCEHVWINFFLGNLSRGLTHELVRHRVGIAISQRSTRYVDENESAWVFHPLIIAYCKSPEGAPARASNGEQVELSMEQRVRHVQTTASHEYGVVVKALQKWLEAKGIDKFTARKQARGAARGLLGNALLTEMVWSVNVRTLRGTILKQRANAAADAEIRAMGVRLWEEALPYYPNYLGDFKRRPCVDGLSDELYLPNSPVEQLKEARITIASLQQRISSLESGGQRLIGEPGNGG